MKVHEIICKSALTPIREGFPYRWDLNIYRGCSHRCIYCYALYSHRYLNDQDFYNQIYIKTNIDFILEKEFKKNKNNGQRINLGGVTDSYQKIEEKYKIMPKILKKFIKYSQPLLITTKSDLILRDKEYYEELSKKNYLSIGTSINTLNKKINKNLEPGAIEAIKRIEMLAKFNKQRTHLLIMPLIPHLTDDEENLEQIFKVSHKNQVNSIIIGYLNLRGETKTNFIQKIRQLYPDKSTKILSEYKGSYINKDYTIKKNKFIKYLYQKYKLTKHIDKFKNTPKQQTLF